MEATRKGMATVGAIAVIGVAGAVFGLMAREGSEPAAASLADAPEVTVYKTPT